VRHFDPTTGEAFWVATGETLFCGISSNGWLLSFDSDNDRFTVTGHDLSAANCPYWGVQDLFHALGTKLTNCLYAIADKRKGPDGGVEFHYREFVFLSLLDVDKLKAAIINAQIGVDFDARTGHNHGTKFRAKQGTLVDLYANVDRF
jgi:MvaI/BcnI restriction endonuclease family